MPGGPESDQDRTVIASKRGDATLLPGDKILNDTYVICRLIGKGGMGEVYEAEHIELGARRAIKIILPEHAKNTQYVGLFIEEARKLSRVNNDAIVRYYEFSRDAAGARYLVMEFVAGDSLATVLEGRRLAPAEILGLLERLAQGLSAAYDQGIKAHRDISPANILLPQGRVDQAKVIDFGIAKSADPAGVTLIGSDFAGKYSFMSPEQVGLFGGQEEVNERSDIYSLGLLLASAAMGFGKRLDMGNEPASVIRARQDVPDLSAIPAELRPLLSRMLQPRQQDRPETMRALIGETRELAQQIVGQSPAPRATSHSRQKRRPVWPLASGAAGLALVVAIAAFFLWPRSPEEPSPPIEGKASETPVTPLSPPISTTSPASDAAKPQMDLPIPPVAPATPPMTEPTKPPVVVSASSPIEVPKPQTDLPPPPSAAATPPTTEVEQPTADLPAQPTVAVTPPTTAAPKSQVALSVPPPAPATPNPRAELDETVKSLDCASLHNGKTADGAELISGTVANAQDQATLLAVAGRLPVDARPQIHVDIVPPPVCRSLDAFDKLQADGQVARGGIEIRLTRGGRTLHEGDPIAVEVKSLRDYPVNLRIDYFTLGGEVLHMWPNAELPNARLAAGQTLEFLHSGHGDQVWQVGGAPFGTELITVTATPQPLDLGAAQPPVEPAGGYLLNLKNALEKTASPAGQPSLAATALIHTGAK
jgi:serine/threonine protein kinase